MVNQDSGILFDMRVSGSALILALKMERAFFQIGSDRQKSSPNQALH
jgi:hypothetical protein